MVSQMLEFINNLAIDDKLYWRISGREGSLEISWKRSERPRPWSIRQTPSSDWQAYTTQDFEKALEVGGINLDEFERQLGVSILSQAVFADMVTGAAKQLLGDEVVARSVADTRQFLNSVSAMAAQHAHAPSKPRLRLVSSLDTRRS